MTHDDGVALTSIAHPRPVWWKRPWYWLRCQWSYVRIGRSLITVKIDIQKNGGKLRIPKRDVE